jgi:hypothetical protein
MAMERTLDAAQKAFEINLDNSIYGTFAEIGAGQEVARHFFRAGGAAGTIAKSMSAYDMTVSDDIYGRSGRYVSKERVVTMLDHEYGQLIDRLGKDRGKETRFFVFADTVAAKSFKYNSECHGWMGVRFQHEPEEECSQIVIHVRMEDQVNLQQQEALGILGTNLIHNCFRLRENRVEFVRSLMDNITTDRILIDYISVSGPGFTEQDSRLWPLELVKRGFTEAILFGRDGEVLSTKDIIYKKNVLVSRASYRPPTHFNLDMLAKGQSVFCENLTKEEQESVLILPEISMSKLKERGQVISEDFLARVDLLGSLGQMCLITSFNTYGELSYYLNQYTNERVAFVMGYYNLQEVFNHEKYADKPGGLFGGIGALLGHRTQLFVYPALVEDGKSILKTKDADVTDEIKPLIDYLISIKRIKDIDDYDKDHFAIWSRVVLKMIQNKEDGWEEMVPEVVAKTVKERCLFEYPCDPS